MGVIKATGILGTILALIVVAIAFFKQLIAFIGFLTFAIKAVVILAFIVLFLGIGLFILRNWTKNKRQKDKA